MKKKRILLFSVLFCMGTLLTAFAADTHSLGYSSVDAGEIRWGGSAKYSTGLTTAISRWNGLGLVNIAPDIFWTIEDLTFKDISRSDVSWDGQVYTKIRCGPNRV
jgi:hypothetical protein